jgi:hypothetical protein
VKTLLGLITMYNKIIFILITRTKVGKPNSISFTEFKYISRFSVSGEILSDELLKLEDELYLL